MNYNVILEVVLSKTANQPPDIMHLQHIINDMTKLYNLLHGSSQHLLPHFKQIKNAARKTNRFHLHLRMRSDEHFTCLMENIQTLLSMHFIIHN